MVLNLEIETRDREFSAKFPRGESVYVGDNVRLESQGVVIRKAFGFPDLLTFVVSIGTGVGASLAANLLYDWLRSSFKRPSIETIKIDRTEIDLDDKQSGRRIRGKCVMPPARGR